MEQLFFLGNINIRAGVCNFSAKAFQVVDEEVPTFVIKYDNGVTHTIKPVGKFWQQVTYTETGQCFVEKEGEEIEKIFSSK